MWWWRGGRAYISNSHYHLIKFSIISSLLSSSGDHEPFWSQMRKSKAGKGSIIPSVDGLLGKGQNPTHQDRFSGVLERWLSNKGDLAAHRICRKIWRNGEGCCWPLEMRSKNVVEHSMVCRTDPKTKSTQAEQPCLRKLSKKKRKEKARVWVFSFFFFFLQM